MNKRPGAIPVMGFPSVDPTKVDLEKLKEFQARALLNEKMEGKDRMHFFDYTDSSVVFYGADSIQALVNKVEKAQREALIKKLVSDES